MRTHLRGRLLMALMTLTGPARAAEPGQPPDRLRQQQGDEATPPSGLPPLAALIRAALRHNGLTRERVKEATRRARWAGGMPELSLKAAWGDQDGLRSVARFDAVSPEAVTYTYDRDDGFELKAEARWRPGALLFSDQEPQLLRESRLLGARREAIILAVVEAWSRRRRAQLEAWKAPPAERLQLGVEIEGLTARLEGLTGQRLSQAGGGEEQR